MPMITDSSTAITLLADKLHQGDLVVFLGAGASRTYVDTRNGKTFPGIPAAGEIVQQLVKSKPYVKDNMTFPQAMFMIKKTEHRNEVERILEDAIDNPTLVPLPVHRHLAVLPFSAYITTNYDRFIEEALQKEGKRFIPIIEEGDVSSWRNSQIPVIKLHGCISRPTTMIAAEDEYQPLLSSKPLISSMLSTLLANKTVLFLGFSLADDDFKALYQEVKGILQDNMPSSYSIVYRCEDYQRIYWSEQGISIIESDLTAFIRQLFRTAIPERIEGVSHPDDDWINNAFFDKLRNIRTQPSETQVIDAFLEHLLSEIQSNTYTCEDVVLSADSAVNSILRSKPNLHAFKKMWKGLHDILMTSDSNEAAEESVADLIEDRRKRLVDLSRTGRSIVKKGDSILLFSQSIQMLEALKTVPKATQDTCKLYVCECRPKSPKPFQDAMAICEYLNGTGYEITLIPDVTIGNLMSRNQIDRVLMGAHSVYFKNGVFYSFVNTCGSGMIASICQINSIPLHVIADESKIVYLEENDDEEVSYSEEENIFDSLDRIGSLRVNGNKNIKKLNIGYDLIRRNTETHLVTIRSTR